MNTTAPQNPQPKCPAHAHQFELVHLSKSFNGQPVLDNLSLKLETGKTTVILGPSGCGKTTLLKHLILLIRPDQGQVLFNNQRIDNLSEKDLIPIRQQCSYLFQAGALFDSMTVGENVAFPLIQHTTLPRSKVKKIAQEKLDMVGLAEKMDQMPAELSGGQQKRVALARAIALSPQAILYDEPTTGLDSERGNAISELIIKLQKELHITSVVVTHDLKNARKIADRIIMLENGQILTESTTNDIFKMEQQGND